MSFKVYFDEGKGKDLGHFFAFAVHNTQVKIKNS